VIVFEKPLKSCVVETAAKRNVSLCLRRERGCQTFLTELTEKEWEAAVIDPYTTQAYYNDIMRVTQGLADPEMSKLIVDQSLETMRWMTTKLDIKWTWTKLWTVVIEGRRYFSSGALLDAEKEGIGLSDMLFKAAEERQIKILYETRAVRLLMNSKGWVNGATILDKQGFHDVKAKAVILASGGFQSNPEMRVKYLGGDWNSVKVRGAKHNTGDMLREVLDIGAKSTGIRLVVTPHLSMEMPKRRN
jgi:tricarballylate dehydrogenase